MTPLEAYLRKRLRQNKPFARYILRGRVEYEILDHALPWCQEREAWQCGN